jgi:hypothetical protein
MGGAATSLCRLFADESAPTFLFPIKTPLADSCPPAA